MACAPFFIAMSKCPNCGHDMPRDNGRIGSTVLEGFMDKIGGSSSLSEGLAEHYENTKDNQRLAGPMYRMLIEMIQNDDKARANQNYADDVAEIQERGFVMEYVLADRGLLEAINATAVKRGLLLAPNVLEAEYERVT